MRHGGGGCGGGVHRCWVCGPESGPARRSGYYIEVPPVERTRSGGRCASLHRLLVVAGRLVAHRAALVALVCGLASAAVAQPAPRPRAGCAAQGWRRRPGAARSAALPLLPAPGGVDQRHRRVALRAPRRPTASACTCPRRPASSDVFGLRHRPPFSFRVPYPTKLAPVVADGRVLVTGDTVIDALKADDGSPLWKALLAAPAAFAPIARGGWVFVALTDGAVAGLRADTGAAVWRAAIGQPAAAPVVEGDRLYAAATGGSAAGALGHGRHPDVAGHARRRRDGDGGCRRPRLRRHERPLALRPRRRTRPGALALSHPGRGDRVGGRRGSRRRGDARPDRPGLQDRQRRAGVAAGARRSGRPAGR